MKFKDSWNNRVLIVDDQKEIHRDFDEMLKPELMAEASTDGIAKSIGLDVNDSFLPDFEIIHAEKEITLSSENFLPMLSSLNPSSSASSHRPRFEWAHDAGDNASMYQRRVNLGFIIRRICSFNSGIRS